MKNLKSAFYLKINFDREQYLNNKYAVMYHEMLKIGCKSGKKVYGNFFFVPLANTYAMVIGNLSELQSLNHFILQKCALLLLTHAAMHKLKFRHSEKATKILQLREYQKDLEYRLHHRLSKFDGSVFLILKSISYFLEFTYMDWFFYRETI